MDHMYIRHSVGSTLFFDSRKHAGSYSMEPASSGEGYAFTIHQADEALAELLLFNRNELNIFVVPHDDPHKKTWYYSTNGLAEYHADTQQFIIRTDRQLHYSV